MSKKAVFQYKFGDMVAIFGGTGSGKTWLSLGLLNGINAQVNWQVTNFILDTKQAGDFDELVKKGYGVIYRGNELPPTQNPNGEPYVIWQPEYDDKDMYNAFFEKVYRSKMPCIVYIDELSNIVGGTGHPPKFLDILWKQGRGLRQSIFAVSQTARHVPISYTSQMMHSFVMNLNSSKDKKKLEDLLGDMAKKDVKHKHGFFYRNVTKPLRSSPPIEYKDVNEFLFGEK